LARALANRQIADVDRDGGLALGARLGVEAEVARCSAVVHFLRAPRHRLRSRKGTARQSARHRTRAGTEPRLSKSRRTPRKERPGCASRRCAPYLGAANRVVRPGAAGEAKLAPAAARHVARGVLVVPVRSQRV